MNTNFMGLNRQELGLHLLRLSLASVFIWFGFSQIFDGVSWVNVVPDWAVNLIHLPPAFIVLMNGAMEIILGGLLAMGFFVRIISFILALHLLPIALSFGFTATAVRDIGLSLATLSLFLMFTKTIKTEN